MAIWLYLILLEKLYGRQILIKVFFLLNLPLKIPIYIYTCIFDCNLGDRLNKGESLSKGETLISENDRFTLELQLDGDLALKFGLLPVLWTTGTSNQGERLVMQNDGKLVLLDKNNRVLFSTSKAGKYLQIKNDGNLVLLDDLNEIVWSTNTIHCNLTFLLL